MTKNYWVVELPKDWKGDYKNCPMVEHGCGEFGECDCPLSNARKTVEVEGVDSHVQLDGKPVRLFAVENTEDKTP